MYSSALTHTRTHTQTSRTTPSQMFYGREHLLMKALVTLSDPQHLAAFELRATSKRKQMSHTPFGTLWK